MDIRLRLAQPHEAESIMEIIEMARAHLKAQDVDQWQGEYPDIACIRADIARQKGYFVEMDGQNAGYVCVDFGGEPYYDELDGEWQSDEPYVVAHRMAFADAARGKGVAVRVFALAADIACERGVHAFRVDTHPDNRKMQHILRKSGFEECGMVWYDEGERIAFDKKI